jgi:hypothetical protein
MATELWKNLVVDFKNQRWEGVLEHYENLKRAFFNLQHLPVAQIDGIELDQAASDGAAFAAAQDMAIRARRNLQMSTY